MYVSVRQSSLGAARRNRLSRARPMVLLSDEEQARAKAYEEQVARASAMKEDPTLRPPSKPLIKTPSLASVFGNPFAPSSDGEESSDGGGDVRTAFDKARAGWVRAVEQQRAANRGLQVTTEPDEASAPDASGEEAKKIAALEEELQALKLAKLEAELEALKKMQGPGGHGEDGA